MLLLLHHVFAGKRAAARSVSNTCKGSFCQELIAALTSLGLHAAPSLPGTRLNSKELEVLLPLQLMYHVAVKEEVEGEVWWVLLVLVGEEEEAQGGPGVRVGVWGGVGGEMGVVGGVITAGGQVCEGVGQGVKSVSMVGEEDLGHRLVRAGFRAVVGRSECGGIVVAWVVESDWGAWREQQDGGRVVAAAQQLMNEIRQL